MRIELDQDVCVGSGNCVVAAPDVFDQRDDDGIAVLLEENPSAERESAVKEAEAMCPALAIHVHKK